MSLQDDTPPTGVVLAPAHDPRFKAMEFFAFMRDAFPCVRRIAYTKRALERSSALVIGLLDVVLNYPTPLHRLAEALQSRLDPAVAARRSGPLPEGTCRAMPGAELPVHAVARK
jgi:hypothetical protein